jgi:hypothetical protein
VPRTRHGIDTVTGTDRFNARNDRVNWTTKWVAEMAVGETGYCALADVFAVDPASAPAALPRAYDSPTGVFILAGANVHRDRESAADVEVTLTPDGFDVRLPAGEAAPVGAASGPWVPVARLLD